MLSDRKTDKNSKKIIISDWNFFSCSMRFQIDSRKRCANLAKFKWRNRIAKRNQLFNNILIKEKKQRNAKNILSTNQVVWVEAQLYYTQQQTPEIRQPNRNVCKINWELKQIFYTYIRRNMREFRLENWLKNISEVIVLSWMRACESVCECERVRRRQQKWNEMKKK